MPITAETFKQWMTAFGERWKPLDQKGYAVYWQQLYGQFSSDQQFEQVMIAVYGVEHIRFPAIETILEVKRSMSQHAKQQQFRPALTDGSERAGRPPAWLSQVMYFQRTFKRQGIHMKHLEDQVWEIRYPHKTVQIAWNGQIWDCRDEDTQKQLAGMLVKRETEKSAAKQERSTGGSRMTSLSDSFASIGL